MEHFTISFNSLAHYFQSYNLINCYKQNYMKLNQSDATSLTRYKANKNLVSNIF